MHGRIVCLGVIGWLAFGAACGGPADGTGDTRPEANFGIRHTLLTEADDGDDGPCSGRVDFGQPGGRIDAELDIARRTVCRKYLHLADALADGYVNTGLACVPGQGYHYIKNSLVGTTDIRRPPVLMYTADGELNGPEWVTSQAAPAPVVFGQVEHADDDLGLWILHVWVWKLNPNGVFDDVNPAVTCP